MSCFCIFLYLATAAVQFGSKALDQQGGGAVFSEPVLSEAVFSEPVLSEMCSLSRCSLSRCSPRWCSLSRCSPRRCSPRRCSPRQCCCLSVPSIGSSSFLDISYHMVVLFARSSPCTLNSACVNWRSSVGRSLSLYRYLPSCELSILFLCLGPLLSVV